VRRDASILSLTLFDVPTRSHHNTLRDRQKVRPISLRNPLLSQATQPMNAASLNTKSKQNLRKAFGHVVFVLLNLIGVDWFCKSTIRLLFIQSKLCLRSRACTDTPQSNDLYIYCRGPTELVQHSAYRRSSHQRKGATNPNCTNYIYA
jgi:hypothetical protein